MEIRRKYYGKFRKFIDFCCDEGIIEDEDGELDDRLEEFFDGLNRK